MAVAIASHFTQRIYQWTAWKAAYSAKAFAIQYDNDGTIYLIWGYDEGEVHLCTIWLGTLPDSIIAGGYSQAQNDTDKADFVANYLPYANVRISERGTYLDSRIIHRFGNLTATSTAEVLISIRPYVEPASQAQRSVKSSSASDTNSAGAGVKQVRITYLNSKDRKSVV